MSDPSPAPPPDVGNASRIAEAEFRKLEEGRRRLVSRVGQMPPEAQRWTPPRRRGTWCPLQVLDHLVRVEARTTRALQEGLPERRQRKGLRDRLGRTAVRLVFGLGLRVRTPTPEVDPAPPEELTLGDLEQRWLEVREDLRVVVREEGSGGEPRMLHPVSGPLTTAETLSFLRKHQAHHLRQLLRIQSRPGFPWAVR